MTTMTSAFADDRRWFTAMVTIAAADAAHSPPRPLAHALGVGGAGLGRLLQRYLPQQPDLLIRAAAVPDAGPDTLEEPDLRALLLECRAGRPGEEEQWLAAIIARRSLEANHLWQDLGLADRNELGQMLRRHFPELVRRNQRDMKWKKFFYRTLCEREGVLVCKSPVCDYCNDFPLCFGDESGEALTTLAVATRHRIGQA